MESYPRWTYVVIFTLLVVVVVLSVRALRKKNPNTVAIAPVEKSAPGQEVVRPAVKPDQRQQSTPLPADKPDNPIAQPNTESERRIQELAADVDRLRKENEANAGRVKDLEAKLADTRSELAAAQQKLKSAQKQFARAPAPAAPLARDRTVALAPSSPSSKAQPPRDRTAASAPPAPLATPPPQAPPRRAS